MVSLVLVVVVVVVVVVMEVVEELVMTVKAMRRNLDVFAEQAA